MSLEPNYRLGSHRLVPPETTLARITPFLAELGITRLADITHLDVDLGVPTYTAIRPSGEILQSSNGKGMTKAAAKVSALMESLEFQHAEQPERTDWIRASEEQLRREGRAYAVPRRDKADGYHPYNPRRMLDWTPAEELVSGQATLVPACAACFVEPTIYKTTTNGLASGNHLIEATLHALYEVIERDALARLDDDGKFDIRGKCRVVDTSKLGAAELQRVVDAVERAGSRLVLIELPTDLPVHAFMAVLLNLRAHHGISAFNTGYGVHVDVDVAAARAITETVQSRLTMIQASRDDVVNQQAYAGGVEKTRAGVDYFRHLQPNAELAQVAARLPREAAPNDLEERLQVLLEALARSGHDRVYRVDLTKPRYAVPVVKVIVPSMHLHRGL